MPELAQCSFLVRMHFDPDNPGQMRSVRTEPDGREYYIDNDGATVYLDAQPV